jgi:hypothetical protein
LAGWPARLITDRGRRAKVVVGKAEAGGVFAERGNLERKICATRAGAGNRIDPDEIRAFLDGAGFQACDFGLGPPRLALLGKKSAAAPRQRYKDEGADEIPTNSARHAENFNEFI